MKLKFTSQVEYRGKVFARKGEIKEVSEEFGFAARWIKRGAVVVEDSIEETVEDVEETVEEISEEVEEAVEAAIESVENAKDAEEKAERDIDAMKKEEVIAFAAEMNIELPSHVKKVADIKAHVKAQLEVEDMF